MVDCLLEAFLDVADKKRRVGDSWFADFGRHGALVLLEFEELRFESRLTEDGAVDLVSHELINEKKKKKKYYYQDGIISMSVFKILKVAEVGCGELWVINITAEWGER